MRRHGVKRLFFASTSAVFGEAQGDLHEDFGPLQPISFYGASKLGAEGYTSVYCNQHKIRTVILRFHNVIGERSTHGVIFDFLRKLKANPAELEVLGDGNQQKPYLYVGDLVDAILVAWDKAAAPFSVYHASGIDSTIGARDRQKSWSRPPASPTPNCASPAAIAAGRAMCRNSATTSRA